MASTVLACWAHLFKGCRLQDASPHRHRKFLLRAQCQSKRTIINDCSSQAFAYGASCGRRMLLLTACFPIMLIENDKIFRSNYRSNILAVEVEEAEIQEIKTEMRKVLSKAKAAGLLRLVFHDAGTFDMAKNTGGMNGSIIYELDRPENTGLIRSVKVLEKVKAVLDMTMQVSWADLIALAGAEAVAVCGGPTIHVSLGRRDTKSPDPDGELPVESLNAAGLKDCFHRKGFLTQDLVALSGAHTLGNKGFGNPTSFDNSYFQTLLEKPWLKARKMLQNRKKAPGVELDNGSEMGKMIGLPSDRALIEDEECFRWITTYANDQRKFFDDFSKSYVKLVNSGVSWRTI